MQDLKEQEIQGNMTPKNIISQANYKEMEIWKLSNKAFKIVVLRKFTELQEKMERQFIETRKWLLTQTHKKIMI